MSAMSTACRASRTTLLMRSQLSRIRQSDSMLHAPLLELHSVSPKGWSSSASITSAMVMRSGGRAST